MNAKSRVIPANRVAKVLIIVPDIKDWNSTTVKSFTFVSIEHLHSIAYRPVHSPTLTHPDAAQDRTPARQAHRLSHPSPQPVRIQHLALEPGKPEQPISIRTCHNPGRHLQDRGGDGSLSNP